MNFGCPKRIEKPIGGKQFNVGMSGNHRSILFIVCQPNLGGAVGISRTATTTTTMRLLAQTLEHAHDERAENGGWHVAVVWLATSF